MTAWQILQILITYRLASSVMINAADGRRDGGCSNVHANPTGGVWRLHGNHRGMYPLSSNNSMDMTDDNTLVTAEQAEAQLADLPPLDPTSEVDGYQPDASGEQ